MYLKYWLVLSISFLIPFFTHAASDPVLSLHIGENKKSFKQSELLKNPKVESLKLKTPAYENELIFKAIKVSELFKDIKIEHNAVIQFKALDGFAAPISKERILNTSEKGSIAYLAIEDPTSPWPVIPKFNSSAGPFYLVWKNPELSKIGSEEWPLMLTSFEAKGTLESLYPGIFPNKKLEASHPAQLGFKVFTKNCFACHTLNKQGASTYGPDLNVPMNPTEYLQESALKKLIRNPQTVRHWPLSRMLGFSTKSISEKELNDLISYLKHMAEIR